MSQTMGEFKDINKPYNYFSFSNTTHELIIDIDGKILSLHPHVNTYNGKSDNNLIFVRGGILFQHYRINHLLEEKIVYVYHEDLEIIKFSYANYFQIRRTSYSDVDINL